jgi:hypothetical protein
MSHLFCKVIVEVAISHFHLGLIHCYEILLCCIRSEVASLNFCLVFKYIFQDKCSSLTFTVVFNESAVAYCQVTIQFCLNRTST